MGSGLRGIGANPASPPYTQGPYRMSEIVNFQKPSVDGFDRYTLEENYNLRPQLNATIDQVFTVEAARAASKDFEILGTNAADADITFASTVGGVQLATAGADNDQVIVLPHLDTDATAWAGVLWGTENQTIWECIVLTDTAVATTLLWAGLKLTNTPTIATDADQVFFRYDTDVPDTNWQVISSIGGTDTTTDSGVVVAASTVYYFRIEIDSNRQATCFINDVAVFTTAALTDNVDFIPYVGIQALTGSARNLNLVKQKISRFIFE